MISMVEEVFEIEERAPVPAGPAAAADDPSGSPVSAVAAIVVRVRLEPGPGRAVVAGRQGDALRVRVAAQPGTERAARAAGVALAELFGVGEDQVTAAGGGEARRGRLVRLRVSGVDVGEARRTLERAVAVAVAGTGAGGPRSRDRTEAPRRPGAR